MKDLELYGYLQRYLGDARMAEDAFQAAFLRVHLNCHRFQEGHRVRLWVYSIATHEATDLLRRKHRRRAASLNTGWNLGHCEDVGYSRQDVLATRENKPRDDAEATETRHTVEAALQELPEPLRQVLILVVYQRFKYPEVAEVLGIPLEVAKSRVSAAIQGLGSTVKGLGRTEP